jgi:flagellar hook-associated protein 1 FlgK
VANADNPLYTRKSANVITDPGAGARIDSISRTSEPALLRNLLAASSDSSAQRALLDALNQLDQTVNDPELDASPAALISKLTDAIQQYAAQPHNDLAGQAALRAAQDVVNALNSAAQLVQQVRADADAAIASSVERVRTLLSRFETVNAKIVDGTRSNTDVTDYLDTRDQILAELADEIGIRTAVRSDNDMVIFTDSGVTLFDKIPRALSFDPTLSFAAGVTGNPVYIDAVPVTGSNATLPLLSGRLKGLADVRDGAAVTYQRQLDEIARGLIEVFAESDQDPTPSLPDAPGLFTYPGAPAMPASGTVVDGLAAVISINPNVDPAQGGLLTRLRDGGIADPLISNYVYNTSGGAGFSGRLEELHVKLNTARAFDSDAGLEVSTSVLDFSSSSVGWLQEARKTADSQHQYLVTLYERSSEALSKKTGVNLDEEMTILLELERSYQASSRLISVIDEMFNALVVAVG